MNRVTKLYYLIKLLGPGFLWQRGRMLVEKRLGIGKQRFAARPWASFSLSDLCSAQTPTSTPPEYAAFKRGQQPAFLFPLGAPPSIDANHFPVRGARTPDLTTRLELAVQLRAVYFFKQVAAESIDWNVNGLSGARARTNQRWDEIPDFAPQQGDVRTLWEPARGAWALDLMRGAARGVAPNAADVYWRWADSWMDACPPFDGVQWKCGQESSVRFIALAMSFWSFANAQSTTDDRFVQFAKFAYATGYRVFHHIDYAVSQRNNHAISEACGLMIVAHLFPEFRDARIWWEKGRSVLAAQLREQIYSDGSYIQHSFNYQRVMLHGALLALRLAELAQQPFERDVYDLLWRSADQLYAVSDATRGALPNYGQNDGALILPLDECAFDDCRPVVQAVHYLARRQRVLPPGPWDESLHWLFGTELDEHSEAAQPAPNAFPERSSNAYAEGGYFVIRAPRHDAHALLRAHTYRDRPGQLDPLHVDLWIRGVNILHDAGTYQYFLPSDPALEAYFKSTRAHNTLSLPSGTDPYHWATRFLVLPWPRARGTLNSDGSVTANHQPADGVRHTRRIEFDESGVFRCRDEITSQHSIDIEIAWHLAGVDWEDNRHRLDPAEFWFQSATAAVELTLRDETAEPMSTPSHSVNESGSRWRAQLLRHGSEARFPAVTSRHYASLEHHTTLLLSRTVQGQAVLRTTVSPS